MRILSLRLFYLLPLLAVLVMQGGCAVPSGKIVDSGHPVIHVVSHTAPAYTTLLKDGEEYRVSRSPVGQFGGSFYSSSIGSGPKTFNPLVSTDATSGAMGDLMFAGLMDMDAYTGNMVPALAKSVDVLPDHLTYRVTMRKGLTWSDGQPLTADDVVFTWNAIILKGLGNPSTRDVVMVGKQLPTVRKVDNLIVEFKTPKPFAPFIQNLGTPILPMHIIAPVIRNNPKAFDSFWGVSTDPSQFVVSGPFKLKEYLTGQRAVFVRNPRYYMVDKAGQRLPYLAQYVVEFVQDQNAELLQFEQGHLDTMGVPGSQVFYVKHLQTNFGFKLYDLGPNTGTIFLMFNLNNRKNKTTGQPYVEPVKSAWFRSLAFRRAVDFALNRGQIVDNILMGVGAPLFTPEGLSSVFLNPKLAKGHPVDLNQARALLKSAGFHWNGQNQLLDKTNHRVAFELNTNTGNLEREAVGVSLKNDLAQLGIQVNFKPIDFNVLVGKMDTSEWEAMVMGLTGSPTEPNGGKNVWASTAALHMFNQRNPTRDIPANAPPEPWEAQLDTLFDTGATTFDLQKRHAIYNQYQQVVVDNLPLIYIYSPKSIIAVRDRVQNLDPTPLGAFHNLESLWVK